MPAGAVLALAAALALFGGAALALSPAGGDALEWLTDFDEATRQSRIENAPVLVVASMAQCAPCRMFERTLEAPEVRAALEGLVLFGLDMDRDWETARRLGVAAAPTVIMIAPNGVTARRTEGYMGPPELLEWLAEAGRTVALLDPAELAQKDPQELIPLLGARDPVIRATATQALAGRPAAAPDVVEALNAGSLASRLGALELLRLWGAPTGDLDPWKPQTIPPAIDAIRSWAEHPGDLPEAFEPDAEAVERDLTLWLDGDEGPGARAAYERLARVGPGLLPRLRALMPPVWDERGERVAALRYRVLMPGQAALRFPQVPFQMAAPDAAVRLAALGTLAEAGVGGLDDFFLEAFTDPDPKVREAALRGLRATGGEVAREHVVKLLADPSPNVRASVLRELLESPLPEVAGDLAAYAFAETDEDLVVHAIQALRVLRSKGVAFDALVKLTGHKSWRVRAAAVESFGDVSTSGRALSRLPKGKDKVIVRMLERALRDEDVFVISKAMSAIKELDRVDVSDCLDELKEVAIAQPELTVPALETMAGNRYLRPKAAGAIKELCRNERPEVRAAAVGALPTALSSMAVDEVTRALDDPVPSVRIAACRAIWEWFGRYSSDTGSRSRVPLGGERRERLLGLLRKAASADDPEERFFALLSLGALGDVDVALAGLREVLPQSVSHASEVVDLVPFLRWSKRKKLFQLLGQFPLDDHTWAGVFARMLDGAPKSAESFLWEVFETDPHVLASPGKVLSAILEFYEVSGGLWIAYGTGSSVGAKRLAARARQQLGSASPERAVMGLVLLCRVDRAAGTAEARKLVDAPPGEAPPQPLRKAALELLLGIGGPEQEGLMLSTLDSPDEELRQAAFESALRAYSPFAPSLGIHVGEELLWTQFLRDESGRFEVPTGSGRGASAWTAPELPEALTADRVRPFLSSSDPEIAAGAAYLMVLTGDRARLAPLVAAWRASKGDPQLGQALAQAVAAIGDDENVGFVREVYESFDADERDYRAAGLYRGIRGMDGPKARQLRKRMRQEVGRSLFD